MTGFGSNGSKVEGIEPLGGNLTYYRTEFVDNESGFAEIGKKFTETLLMKDGTTVPVFANGSYVAYTSADEQTYSCFFEGTTFINGEFEEFISFLKSLPKESKKRVYILLEDSDTAFYRGSISECGVENIESVSAVPAEFEYVVRNVIRIAKVGKGAPMKQIEFEDTATENDV